MRTPKLVLLALLSSSLLACSARADAPLPPSYDSRFWSHWSDGKAELAAYDLVFPRYGELRRGSAVTIFVTETFSDSARVKADPGKHPKADEVAVMKLNFVVDFQTGIYDYNTMSSAFVLLAPRGERPAGSLSKVSFSSQEWCGHVWHQLLFDDDSVREVSHSYFDGEADVVKELPQPRAGLSEDALLLWARGLAGPRLAPGQKLEVPFLPSLMSSRLAHRPLAWGRARLERAAGATTVTVPAGTFEVELRKVTSGDDLVRSYYVESAWPHRLVRFEDSAGMKAELRGAERLKYWEMNHEGQQEALRRIGLTPPKAPPAVKGAAR